MSNYTKTVNFATKDNLSPGNPLKIVKGTEIDTEYNNIATAVATKTDNSAAAITGGTIDGAAIGGTTPAAGAFTTLAASSTTTLAGALVGAVTQAAFNTVSTTLNLGGAATAVNIGAATGTATVANTTLAAKAITASTTLNVTGASTLTGAVTATAGVTGPITSSSVAITGGSITGITDLAVADGGTGSSTAAGGLNNLLPSQTGNANKYLQTDGTNASWDAVSLSTADITGTLGVANGGTGVTTSTGTTNVVLSNSPTLVTPILGTPTSATLTNATGLPISTGVSGLGTGVATLLATPSSANLASAITDETGSGALVFATSPTLVTPILGTPTSGTLTNATGLPLTTGVTGQLPVANGGTGTATPSIVAGTNVTVSGTWPNQTIAASGGGGSPGGSTTQVQYNNAGAFGGITGATTNGTALTLVAPVLGTPASATLTNATGLPISTGVSGLGTGVATALAVNVGSAGAPVVNGGALGTPSGGTVTNLTGTASININGTVGATTPASGAFTSVTSSGVTNSFGSATNANVANLFSGTKTGYAMLAVDSSTLSPVATGDAGIVFIQPAVGNTIQKASTGTHANFASLYVPPPTIGAGASTLTNASSIYVPSAPSGATNNYAISVGSGTTYLNGLVDISGASGGQIKFPATQNASANANTLDDYEEGTWTPTVIGTTVAGTASYTIQTGVYTKIGQLVSVAFRVDYSGGTGSGNLRISGLPFTASNTFNRYGGLEVGDISLGAGNYAVGSVESNTTRVVISTCPTGGAAGGTAAYDSSGYIIFNSTYYV